MTTATKLVKKTFAQICKIKKIDPQISVAGLPEPDAEALKATAEMYVIADYYNEGWKPNWDDSDEYKYFPWFDMDNPGFRFDYSFGWTSSTDSSGGSRICFKSRQISDFVAKTFIKHFEKMMVIPK